MFQFRELTDQVWLHLKDKEGNLAYRDKAKKKPIRIKFHALHSKAFKVAEIAMGINLNKLKEQKQSELESKQNADGTVDADLLGLDLADVYVESEIESLSLIANVACDWEGIHGPDNKPAEFSKKDFYNLIADSQNYFILEQIKKALKEKEGFTNA